MAGGDPTGGDRVYFLDISQEDLHAAREALANSEGELLAPRPVPTPPLLLSRQSPEGLPPEDLRRMLRQMLQSHMQPSAAVRPQLRALPVLLWNPGSNHSLLNLGETDAQP